MIDLYNFYRFAYNISFTRCSYQHHPEMTEYRDTAESIWNTIKTVQIDKETHEWIENIYDDADKNKHQDLAHEWKGPYHNGRMCIEMIKRLETV